MEHDIIAALRFLNVNSKHLLSDPHNRVSSFRAKTLAELCARNFYRSLTSSDITLKKQLELFQKIPNIYVASMIMNYIPSINTMSSIFTPHWILEQYFCDQNDILDRIDQQYRIDDSGDALSSIIQMFNDLDKVKRYPFKINIHLYSYLSQTERLAQLKNLCEVSFYEQNPEILEKTILGWLTCIKVNVKTWSSVTRLNIPFLRDPKILFKLLYYIPSLDMVTVGIESNIIQNIPVLRHCLVSHSLGQEYISKRKLEDDYPTPIEIRTKTFPSKVVRTVRDGINIYYLTVPLNTIEKARQIEEHTVKKAPKPKRQLNKSRINSKFLERFK